MNEFLRLGVLDFDKCSAIIKMSFHLCSTLYTIYEIFVFLSLTRSVVVLSRKSSRSRDRAGAINKVLLPPSTGRTFGCSNLGLCLVK